MASSGASAQGDEPLWKLLTGERRRAIVTANLLCSDLISAFVALFTVDSIFGLSSTETALTGLPILIGLFCVSGLYRARTAASGRAFAGGSLARLPSWARFSSSPANTCIQTFGSRPRSRGLWCFFSAITPKP